MVSVVVGAVQPVLGHRRADGRIRRAGPPPRAAPAHPPVRDDRRTGALPRTLRPSPRRADGRVGLDRRRRVDGPRRALRRRRDRRARRRRHGRGALPVVQRPPRRRHVPGHRPASGGRTGRPRRRRRRQQRGRRTVRRAPPGALHRTPADHGARCADARRLTGSRHRGRRGMSRAQRHRSPRGRRRCRPRRVARRRPRRHRRSGHGPRHGPRSHGCGTCSSPAARS